MPAAFLWTSSISKAFSVKVLRIPSLRCQRLMTVLYIVTEHQNHHRTKKKPLFSFSTKTCLSHWNTHEVQHLTRQSTVVLGFGPGKSCGLLKWCGWMTISSSPLSMNLQMLRLFNYSACGCGRMGQIWSWGRGLFLLCFYYAEHIWAWTMAFKEVRNLRVLPH